MNFVWRKKIGAFLSSHFSSHNCGERGGIMNYLFICMHNIVSQVSKRPCSSFQGDKCMCNLYPRHVPLWCGPKLYHGQPHTQATCNIENVGGPGQEAISWALNETLQYMYMQLLAMIKIIVLYILLNLHHTTPQQLNHLGSLCAFQKVQPVVRCVVVQSLAKQIVLFQVFRQQGFVSQIYHSVPWVLKHTCNS